MYQLWLTTLCLILHDLVYSAYRKNRNLIIVLSMEINSLHHLIVWRLAAIDWSISDSSSSTLWFLASIDCRSRALMLWNYKDNSKCHKISIPIRAVPFNNSKQNPEGWSDHSNETSSTVLSLGNTCLEYSSSLWVCGWNPTVLSFKWNLFCSPFTWYY